MRLVVLACDAVRDVPDEPAVLLWGVDICVPYYLVVVVFNSFGSYGFESASLGQESFLNNATVATQDNDTYY